MGVQSSVISPYMLSCAGAPSQGYIGFVIPRCETVADESQGSMGKFASDICFSSLYLSFSLFLGFM